MLPVHRVQNYARNRYSLVYETYCALENSPHALCAACSPCPFSRSKYRCISAHGWAAALTSSLKFVWRTGTVCQSCLQVRRTTSITCTPWKLGFPREDVPGFQRTRNGLVVDVCSVMSMLLKRSSSGRWLKPDRGSQLRMDVPATLWNKIFFKKIFFKIHFLISNFFKKLINILGPQISTYAATCPAYLHSMAAVRYVPVFYDDILRPKSWTNHMSHAAAIVRQVDTYMNHTKWHFVPFSIKN